MKKMRKLLCFALIFGLVFTSGIFSFADPEDPDFLLEDFTEEVIDDPVPLDDEPVFEPAAVEATSLAIDFAPASADLADLVPGISIKRVQVVDGGATQVRYRNAIDYDVSKYTVYQGDHPTLAVNGETSDLYYTTARGASLLDRRNFTFEIVLPLGNYTGVGTAAGQFNPASVTFSYSAGGWNPLGTATGRQARIEGDFIVFEATIPFGSTATVANTLGLNMPYTPYYNKTNANSTDWARTGNWPFRASYGGSVIGETTIRMALNDSHVHWTEIDAFAKDYIATYGAEGSTEFSAYGRFMRMESFGKTRLGRDIWASIISDSQESLDEYLDVTVPLMNSDPALLQSQIEGGNQKQVIMFNGIHGNEVTGNGVMPDIMDRLLQYETLRFTETPFSQSRRELPTGTTSTGSAGTTQRVDRWNSYVNSTLDIDAFLDKYIVVIVYYSNADGNMSPARAGYYGADPNRDGGHWAFGETRAMAKAMTKFDPLYVMEFHGYVTNYLIDATTPPTEPSLEVDLLEPNVLSLVDAYGLAGLGLSGYDRYNAPMRDMPGGWDTAAVLYTPAMAMMWSSLGTTVEFPRSGQDDVDVGVQGVFGLFKHALAERDHYLNVKLEMKRRGVENIDAKDLVDPTLVAISPLIEEVYSGLSSTIRTWINNTRAQMARPRLSDADGNELPFFPDYYVFPVDRNLQYSPSGAVEALIMLQDLGGVKINRSTEAVTHNGVTYPAGTYLIDMRQGNRNVANTLLYPGFDANNFSTLYDTSTIVSWPGQKGFNTTRVWAPDLFVDKSEPVNLAVQADLPGDGEYVVYMNTGHDAIRLTSRLLVGGKDVWMVTGYVPGASYGDFVASRADVIEMSGVMPNVALGPVALNVFGLCAGDEVPVNTKKLVVPRIATSRAGGNELGLMYDLIEFPASFFSNGATGDRAVHVGTAAATNTAIPQVLYSASNTVVNNTTALGANAVAALSGASGQAEMLGKGSWSSSSIVASNYGLFDQLFTFSATKLTNPRSDVKVLAQFKTGTGTDLYLSGRKGVNNARQYSGSIMAVSGVKSNGAGVTAITENITTRGRYQASWNLFATSVFAYAAGIADLPRPIVSADITESGWTSWDDPALDVQLVIRAEDTAGVNATVAEKKYIISTSEFGPVFDPDDAAWADIPADDVVTLDTSGVQYLHWYVENSKGVASQGSFGPYMINGIDFLSTTTKNFVSMTETAKNSRVWTLAFTYVETYLDGATNVVSYSVNINGNNANLDGKIKFTEGPLAGYTLVYDIKGNGSNIKDLRLI